MDKKCFVICPIGDNDSDVRKRSNQLLEHIIEPVCNECGFSVDRVDLMNNNGSITNQILECLRVYELVIADLSDHNPNVFYELGYRSSLNLPIIQLKSTGSNIPFDIASIKTLDYDLSDLDKVKRLKNELISIINNIDFINSVTPSITVSNSQILSEIYKLQDQIQMINDQKSTYDSELMNIMLDKVSDKKTDDQVIIETMIPLLVKEPEKFMDLIKVINQSKSLING